MERIKKNYNGFAIPLQPDTDLGSAMLIAEDEKGNYEPIALAGTIREAMQIADEDLQGRLRRLEGDEDPGLCPYVYKLWARGVEGTYCLAQEFTA